MWATLIAIKGPQSSKLSSIFESRLEFENNSLVVPVQDMQTVLSLTREVTAFSHLCGNARSTRRGLEELRQRIEAIQPGLEVTRVERQNGDRHSSRHSPNRTLTGLETSPSVEGRKLIHRLRG